MSSTGVRDSNSTEKRVIKGLILNEGQFIQSLRVFANSSTLSGLGSTEGEINNSPQDPSGNYLSRLGDKMLGPLALSPPLDFTIEIDANNTIDIGPLNDNAQYTSNVQLDSIQPNSFVLDIIANAAFDGQLLFLRTFAPTIPFTISQGTFGNGGNIQTGDGNDLTVGDLQIVTLIFDEALIINANTDGSWRVLSVSSAAGGGGITFPIDFPEETDRGIVTTTQVIDFAQGTRHSVAFTVGSATVAIDISNEPANELALSSITVTQDGTGGRAISFIDTVVNAQTIIDAFAATGAGLGISFVVEWERGIFTAYLKTGNIVSSGGSLFSGNLSDLVINVNKDWLAQGISNIGALTGVTGITGTGASVVISGIDTYDFFQGGQSIQNKADPDGGLLYNVADLQSHIFRANLDEIARFEESAAGVFRLNMLDHSARDARDITFSNASGGIIFAGSSPAIGFDSVASSLIINYPTGAKIVVSQNGVVGSTEITDDSIDTTGLTVDQVLLIGILGFIPPVISGEFRNDGTDTFVFSGGVVRNFSNIPTTLSANVNLSNLVSPTSINEDLIPQAGKLLGTDAAPWSDTTSNKFTLGTAGTFAASDNAIIADAATGMEFNTPTGDLYRWFFGSIAGPTLSVSQLDMITGDFRGSGFLLADSGVPPITTGELRRDGDAIIWEAPIFQVQRTITGGLFTQFNLVKVDAGPSNGEPIADINFQLFDSPTSITYASIGSRISTIGDSGVLTLTALADSALTPAMRITGRDSSIRFDIGFRQDTIIKADSGVMGYFVTADPDNLDNLGTAGSIQIPQFTDGSPSLTDLNQAAGAFDAAIIHDKSDGTLYIRNSSTQWDTYARTGTVT